MNERMAREMADAREERALEVAFCKEHPPHSPEVGAQLAAEFVTAITMMTDRMEADFRGLPKPTGKIPDHAPHWELVSYFTPEQKAALAAAYARVDKIELEQKAQNYDELLEALEKIGLCPDMVLNDDGSAEDIITIEDVDAATRWFKNAHIQPPFDDA